MTRARSGATVIPVAERAALERAVGQIIEGYRAGTRFAIGMDHDGLLKAGVPGWQLTWMDAKIGDWVVTPRGPGALAECAEAQRRRGGFCARPGRILRAVLERAASLPVRRRRRRP
jgi:glycogen debranching enzyme